MTTTGQPAARAAFEIRKGIREVTTLSEADVERYLDPATLLDALEEAFRALERGEVQAPPRPQLTVPGKGFCLAMPGWRPGMQLTVKIVSVFEGNLSRNLPSHLALITLLDPDSGAVSCVMDGTYITGVRTAATAVLSARMLSRTNARVATVIGAGVQGREHLRLLPLARDFARINVCSLRAEDAAKVAALSPLAHATADIEAAVRESDVVCLATDSPTPVIDAAWITPGAHVTSIGYHPPGGELPSALAQAHRLFVETLDAFEPSPVGCGELAGLDAARGTTLGAVALGRTPGRLDDTEITVYKGMGLALQDMVAANLAYQRARQEGGGSMMAW